MEWLSLEEAARMLDVDVRSIYRMISRNELESSGEKRGRKVSQASVEDLITKRLAENATKDIDGSDVSQESSQKSKGLARDENRAAVMALQAISQERDKLYDRLEELHEARRQEAIASAKTIGQLEERVRNLEEQLKTSQTAQTGQRRQETPEPVQTTTQIEQAAPPPKKGFWARLFSM